MKLRLLLSIATVFYTTTVQAASETQLQAISEMGKLNGVALHCRYFDQVQRIKMVLVQNLPKQRMLGEWFEQSTNTAFMNFIESDSECPDALAFVHEVDTAVSQLETVFSNE